MTVPIQSAIATDSAVHITWADGVSSQFLHIWLRDNAPELMHATTQHRVVETSEIPADVRPSKTTIVDGDLQIAWAHDGLHSLFRSSWLRANDYTNGARYARSPLVMWDASNTHEIVHVSYPELLQDDEVRLNFLDGFATHGLAFLHDVPNDPGTVLDVARQFGELRTTSWGTVFDVVSMIDANSVAYTNLPLVVHTDEGYRDPAPTVQLQHFLQSETSGGMATLTDGFKVANDLRTADPGAFALLRDTVLRFHFADAANEHQCDAPVITANADGSLRAIKYSNHSAQPFRLPPGVMERYYQAYVLFGRMRESAEYRFNINMRAGDLYMVDNHRIMHGRTGFSGGGARHLQSCYIERDELMNRRAVLRNQLAVLRNQHAVRNHQ